MNELKSMQDTRGHQHKTGAPKVNYVHLVKEQNEVTQCLNEIIRIVNNKTKTSIRNFPPIDALKKGHTCLSKITDSHKPKLSSDQDPQDQTSTQDFVNDYKNRTKDLNIQIQISLQHHKTIFNKPIQHTCEQHIQEIEAIQESSKNQGESESRCIDSANKFYHTIKNLLIRDEIMNMNTISPFKRVKGKHFPKPCQNIINILGGSTGKLFETKDPAKMYKNTLFNLIASAQWEFQTRNMNNQIQKLQNKERQNNQMTADNLYHMIDALNKAINLKLSSAMNSIDALLEERARNESTVTKKQHPFLIVIKTLTSSFIKQKQTLPGKGLEYEPLATALISILDRLTSIRKRLNLQGQLDAIEAYREAINTIKKDHTRDQHCEVTISKNLSSMLCFMLAHYIHLMNEISQLAESKIG